jgi:coenzyme F420 hydrogenase subunit beta
MLQRTRGPKGLEFAHAVIEMNLLRNLVYVRSIFPKLKSRVVPTTSTRRSRHTPSFTSRPLAGRSRRRRWSLC